MSKHDHQTKRKEKAAQERKRDEEWEKRPRSIHPAWFLALGVVLIALVVLTWTLAMGE
jgi:Na+/H+ antiporter NhaD/arsenite permease-like protein